MGRYSWLVSLTVSPILAILGMMVAIRYLLEPKRRAGINGTVLCHFTQRGVISAAIGSPAPMVNVSSRVPAYVPFVGLEHI